MINKRLLEVMARTLVPMLQDILGLKDMDITCTVGHSGSKLFKDLHKGNFSAICCPRGKKGYDIFLCYDKQRNNIDAMGSIVHEMLHVKFRDISLMVRKSKEADYHQLEEDIVAGLERLFVMFIA